MSKHDADFSVHSVALTSTITTGDNNLTLDQHSYSTSLYFPHCVKESSEIMTTSSATAQLHNTMPTRNGLEAPEFRDTSL